MALELKRAKEGTAILTLQFEVEEDGALLLGLLAGDDILDALVGEGEPIVAFLDRPGRGPVVTDISHAGYHPEVAGPAELAFEPAGPAQQPAVPAPAPDQRDNRFDNKVWFQQGVPGVEGRDARFAPLEVK